MEKGEKIQSTFGIVVLLDALGVSAYDIDASIEFISNLQSFKDVLFEKIKEINEFNPKSEPKFFVFGDTILLTIEAKKSNIHHVLLGVARWLQLAVIFGMDCKILWRGAISIGHYINDGEKAIGPAVSDAANWYEKPQLFGVIATPTCGMYINELKELMDLTNKYKHVDLKINESFFKYDVPLKNGQNQFLWTIAWPYNLLDISKASEKTNQPNTPWSLYYSFIREFVISSGTESKYTNTEKYMKAYLDENSDIIDESKTNSLAAVFRDVLRN